MGVLLETERISVVGMEGEVEVPCEEDARGVVGLGGVFEGV